MSLLKRGNIWWTFFHVGGIRHQQSTGTSSRRQAEWIERKLKDEANAQRHRIVQVDRHMTVGELVARFIANAEPSGYYVERLGMVLPFFADIPVLQLTKGIANDYRRYRHSEKKVSDATINRDLAVLRRILYWGLEEGLLTANPWARLRMTREGRTRLRVLSVEEETKLLGAASPHLKQIIIVALDTGMRRGEILNQRWEHVDFPRRLLLVTKSKTADGEGREIPLTERVCEMLSGFRQEEGIVFSYRGSPIKAIKTAWKHALERAGLRHIRFHDLRHCFNSRLVEAGVIQDVRMALMGHSTGQRVHALYTHIELPAKREAIAKLEQWLSTQHQHQGGKYDQSETS